MLRQRILTSLVLIPLLLGALFYLPSTGFALLLGGVMAIAVWEWSALAGLTLFHQRLIYTAGLITLGALGVAATLSPVFATLMPVFLLFSLVYWLWALWELGLADRGPAPLCSTGVGKLVSGFWVLIPSWMAVIYLHAYDPDRPGLLLYLLVLVWVADTAAYAVGTAWGRHKLAPRVSPGKTVEGLVGGAVAVMVLALICGTMVWRLTAWPLAVWMLLALTTTLAAVLGDLVESKFKRVAGVKDSGRILPGHGGMLDRIDAFTCAAPVFVLGWVYQLKPLL